MKKYLPIIFILSLIKFAIQWIGNQNYGFHRDELLHLSVSEHLDWGFMEFPPLIGFIGKLSYWLFDYALWGVRLFPTLAGVAILILCCLMVIEFGGKSKAVLLAGVSILAFLPFYRNHTLFQPVAFSQLFWTAGFYFLIRFIKTQNPKFLFLLGISTGLGLMNKYTIIIWIFGMLVGLIFYNRGELFKKREFYISAFIAFIIFLPNIIWQFQHDLPIFSHLQSLRENQLDEIAPMTFALEQMSVPFTFIVSIIGLVAFFFGKRLKTFRPIGIAVLVTFFTMWILQSKFYYVFGIYPVLFASGAVKIESLLQRKSVLIYFVALILIAPVASYIPQLTPILPIEDYVAYTNKTPVDGRIELTGDYADMFGWEEQVQLIDSVYQSLSEYEKANCVLWAENYGEAGALKILGKKYGLPNPISRHGSFWVWGYGNKDAAVWISLGNEAPSVGYVFEDVRLIKMITHKYAIGEENNIPLYICRNPKRDIAQWWQDYEEHIFD